MSDIDNAKPEILVQAADDSDITLGQFREKTKDMPDDTPLLIAAIVPADYLSGEDDEGEDETETSPESDAESVESANGDDEGDDDEEVITTPILAIGKEPYEDDNGVQKDAITLLMHLDDVLVGDEDEEDGDDEDEPVADNT